jgi:hypothetical protein
VTDLVALSPDEKQLIANLLAEHRRHVLPGERAELDRIRVLLNKMARLEPVR